MDGQVVAYFASALDQLDEARFGHSIGSCTGQQTWESLAVLVAIRLWALTALSRQCFLEIRSDNTGALEMLSSFRSAAGGGLIAREIALDLAEGIFEPMQASHISGLSNDVPDALSRLEEPGAGHTIPPPGLPGP